MNKKASVPVDMFVYLILLLVVAITSLFAFSLYGRVGEEVINTYEDTGGTNPEVNASIVAGERVIYMLDYFWIGLFFALVIGLVITSAMVKVHPALVGVMILILAIIITVSASFTNVYEEVTDQTLVENATAHFPAQNYVMGALPVFMLFIGVLVVIILLAKPRFGGPG